MTKIEIALVLVALGALLLMWRLSRGAGNPGLHLQGLLRWLVWGGSLLAGTVLYGLLVILVHARLVDHVANHALPPSVQMSAGPPADAGATTNWPNVAARQMAQDLDVTPDADTLATLEASWKCPGSACDANPRMADLRSAVGAALGLPRPGPSDTNGPPGASSAPSDETSTCTVKPGETQEACSAKRLKMARQLVGQLSCNPFEQSDASWRQTWHECTGLPLVLSEIQSPQRVAEIEGHDCANLSGVLRCRGSIYLLQGALDDPETRRLQVQFGMVYGVGRWLVLVLAIGVMATLSWRRRVRTYMVESMKRSPFGEAGDQSNANVHGNRPASNDPSPLEDPVAALLAQVARARQDATRVRDAARQSKHEMAGWWDLMFTVITVFPVIGLAATLHGLIHAFAQADRIASAMGDARADAIRSMVAELSASFSTTFIALLVMSVLTLWATRAKHAEERAFTAAVETIDGALTQIALADKAAVPAGQANS